MDLTKEEGEEETAAASDVEGESFSEVSLPGEIPYSFMETPGE